LCTNPKNPRYNVSRPGGCYYYRNERQGGRVVKKYYGRGVVGELAARMAADALRKRREAARAIRELMTDWRLPTLPWRPWRPPAKFCSGPHSWPVVSIVRTIAHGGADVYKVVNTEVDPAEAIQVELREVFNRARRGDLGALPRLRELLDDRPELWQSYGDVAKHALSSWIKLIAGDDLALEESTARKADSMRAEVAGPAPSPLELLLADRVVATWLQLAHAEVMLAQARDASLKLLIFAEKRLEGATRRHINAVGALATLRRLLPTSPALPAIENAALEAKAEAEQTARETCHDAKEEPDEPEPILAFEKPRGRRVPGAGLTPVAGSG
jgi:hypothetical protein